MPFTVVRDNIANVNADAIVLPANPELKEGPGSSHAIFEAAGRENLEKACAEIGFCELGRAVMTDGFNLPARHIIHTVNPLYIDGRHQEEELLYKSYISALELAEGNGLESIAFPLLSAGSYGYPKGSALEIANKAIGDYLARGDDESEMDIRLVLFERDTLRKESNIYDRVTAHLDRMLSVREYMAKEVCEKRSFVSGGLPKAERPSRTFKKASPVEEECSAFTEDLFEDRATCEIPSDFDKLVEGKKTFLEVLMKYMIESEMTNAQIYGSANISRKAFSKIINGNVIPKKETIIALAIALRLTLEQTEDLLARAGYAFIEADTADTIIKYFIQNETYDIFLINEYLFEYGQKLLGSVVA